MTTGYTYEDHLETKRLYTRFLTPEDTLLWSEFFNDKEATVFLPTFNLNSNTDKADQWIKRQLTRYRENNFGLQALILKETKEFVGQCGLIRQEVEGKMEIEVGYHIFKKHWGKGYAPEAARLFINYAFQNKLTSSVISIIDIGNVKSQRVAEKNGLIREKQVRWFNADVYIYRIGKPGLLLS